MAIDLKRAIQLADKHVRKKNYQCLFPGCGKNSIRCHAIPRASLIEALAHKGKLYTLNQSFTSIYRKTSPYDPREIVRVGVNRASVFKGFCQEHDTKLFAPAETTDEKKKKGLTFSLHLKALALEHSRKSRNVDYFKKMIEFDLPPEFMTMIKQQLELYEALLALVECYLGNLFFPEHHKISGHIDYFGIPFSKNLQVSCCGVFNHNNDPDPFSAIGYNIISYKDLSVLVLTTFANEHATLDAFVGGYSGNKGIERLVNDIAFLKGEEPLISAQLWESLSDSKKHKIGLSLVHPAYRTTVTRPRIIKLQQGDFLKEATPAVIKKLGDLTPLLMNPSHVAIGED